MDKAGKTIVRRIAGYILIGVAAYSAYWAWQTSVGSEDQFSQGQMQPCDSSPVRQLLAQTIEQSPRAVQTGLKLIQIGAIEDYLDDPGKPRSPEALDPKTTLRFCKTSSLTPEAATSTSISPGWMPRERECGSK